MDDFVNSLIEQGEVQGFLPIWALWGKENFCMIGNHGVSVIAEAYRKGFRGFDAERAFNMVKKTQTVSHPLKSDWEVYTKYGYFPTDLTKAESVSSTLESVYDDYAAADMARRMEKKKMLLTLRNVQIIIRTYSIHRRILCVRVKLTEPGNLRLILVM